MRSAFFTVAVAVGFLLAVPASAQTVGTTTVTAITSLCDTYLAGTPFRDAAVNAGFGLDTALDEYYFGPQDEVTAIPPDADGECDLVILYTEAEGPELLSSIVGFAEGRQGQKVMDRYPVADDALQYWNTEWHMPGRALMLTEMLGLDGSPAGEEYHVLMVTLSARP
ncbi:MAG: hypothetical protein RJB62_1899 [Pseudomonadota bacterium]|jgi:hypothetical protein